MSQHAPAMLAARWTGRGHATRLIRLGLLGAAVVLVLAAVIAVVAGSGPGTAAWRDTALRLLPSSSFARSLAPVVDWPA